MKQLLRAASIGFGATLGAGAALITTGALVAILARAGVRKSIDDLTVKISEIVDQAAANLAEPPDQTRPEPEIFGPTLTVCGETFPGGQGACKLLKGHPAPHSSVSPIATCTCPEDVQEDPSALHVLTCPYAIAD